MLYIAQFQRFLRIINNLINGFIIVVNKENHLQIMEDLYSIHHILILEQIFHQSSALLYNFGYMFWAIQVISSKTV